MDYQDELEHAPRPSGHLRWSIATTPDVSSRIHLDTAGLCTSSVILNPEGAKWWAIGQEKDVTNMADSIIAYENFAANKDRGVCDWDAVLLRRGDIL